MSHVYYYNHATSLEISLTFDADAIYTTGACSTLRDLVMCILGFGAQSTMQRVWTCTW